MSSRNPRRRLLQGLLLAPLASALPQRAAAQSTAGLESRRLSLLNTHTGETLDAKYFDQGSYLAEVLGQLDWLLRDHRSGEVLPIDRRLFDLLYEIATSAGCEPRYQVISAYRSPATNAMLAAQSDGVSSRSLHMAGLAMDVRLVGLPTATLRDLALARKAGGVGYYPQADFVHLDLGRVRQWSG